MSDVTHWVDAETLTPQGFAPNGRPVGLEDVTIEVPGPEALHVDIIAYPRKPICVRL